MLGDEPRHPIDEAVAIPTVKCDVVRGPGRPGRGHVRGQRGPRLARREIGLGLCRGGVSPPDGPVGSRVAQLPEHEPAELDALDLRPVQWPRASSRSRRPGRACLPTTPNRVRCIRARSPGSSRSPSCCGTAPRRYRRRSGCTAMRPEADLQAERDRLIDLRLYRRDVDWPAERGLTGGHEGVTKACVAPLAAACAMSVDVVACSTIHAGPMWVVIDQARLTVKVNIHCPRRPVPKPVLTGSRTWHRWRRWPTRHSFHGNEATRRRRCRPPVVAWRSPWHVSNT